LKSQPRIFADKRGLRTLATDYTAQDGSAKRIGVIHENLWPRFIRFYPRKSAAGFNM
jgi:hypothetical protein